MPTDASFRFSTYLALALTCAALGYAEFPLLPEAIKLSRPSVSADGPRVSEAADGMQELSDLRLSCEGRPVRIALLQKEEVSSPA